ncbi:MAG: flagellar basal-body MS-ring/collar protein FliF [Anaerovoracaceae bacterium]|jgi:flagellar M-ring protein FliF
MSEQTKKAVEALKQFWSNASGGLKKIIIGSIIAVVTIALVLSIVLNMKAKDYVVIFEQLSQGETSEILSALQDMDVSVKVDTRGNVMVPKKDESRVRMQLATEGYPKNGLSYYLIEENSGMLTTDFERKQFMNMQLQERIAASIKTLDGVRDAVVTVTVPKEDVFYLQEKEKPTASVIIHMKQGQTLTENQIGGILNLVAKSVNGLTKENIALTDNQGNDLIEDGGKNAGLTKLGITREIENDIKKKIISVLVGPYNSDEIKVSVTASVNTDEMIREETIYIPSEQGENSGVISEEIRTQESSSSSQGDGGVPGTSTNSEIPSYPVGGMTGESSSSGSSDHIKYQVSQSKSQTQKSGATVESISIGIAIDKASFPEEERERVTRLVAYATGVGEDFITVQNFRFYSEKAPSSDGVKKKVPWPLYIAIGAGVLILLGIIAIIVIKALAKRKEEEEEPVDDALDVLFGEEEEPIMPITPVQDAKREEVKEFAKSNPEIAAQMIKSWLKSEE